VGAEPGELGFVPPAIQLPDAVQAVAGEEWSFDTGAPGQVAVYGLRGATVDGSVIRWSPPHGGTWKAIVTAVGPAGWAWRELTLRVNNPVPAVDDDNADDDDTDSDDDSENNDVDDGDNDNADDNGCGC